MRVCASLAGCLVISHTRYSFIYSFHSLRRRRATILILSIARPTATCDSVHWFSLSAFLVASTPRHSFREVALHNSENVRSPVLRDYFNQQNVYVSRSYLRVLMHHCQAASILSASIFPSFSRSFFLCSRITCSPIPNQTLLLCVLLGVCFVLVALQNHMRCSRRCLIKCRSILHTRTH